MKHIERQKEKKGSVLLLTLVITMIVVTTAVVLSTLIVSSIKRSQIEATSFSAYYSAESMIERSLYDLRRERKIPYELTQSPSALRATPTDCSTLFPGGDATSKCSGSVSYKTSWPFSNIKKNQKVRVRVIDAASSGENVKAGADILYIICDGVNNTLWVEVTKYALYKTAGATFGTATGPDSNLETAKQVFSCPNNFISSLSFSLGQDESYVVEVKALNDDASFIRLTVNDPNIADGVTPGFGDFFEVSATASNSIFSGQTIRVQVPGTGLASGAGDYVIFSESAIAKTVTCTGGNCT